VQGTQATAQQQHQQALRGSNESCCDAETLLLLPYCPHPLSMQQEDQTHHLLLLLLHCPLLLLPPLQQAPLHLSRRQLLLL
jgi:hypothetical protein